MLWNPESAAPRRRTPRNYHKTLGSEAPGFVGDGLESFREQTAHLGREDPTPTSAPLPSSSRHILPGSGCAQQSGVGEFTPEVEPFRYQVHNRGGCLARSCALSIVGYVRECGLHRIGIKANAAVPIRPCACGEFLRTDQIHCGRYSLEF